MSPHFLPYIGSDYTLGIHGKRVMVLGESHYISAPEDDTPDMTQSVIEWYLNEQKSPETQGGSPPTPSLSEPCREMAR